MTALRYWAGAFAVGICAGHGTNAVGAQPAEVGAADSTGEQWQVTTLVEYYGPKDRAPSRTNRESRTICVKPGSLNISAELITELPPQLVRGCQLGEKRAEANRQQVKFACNNGATAEAATRLEADGSFSSQIVANMPQQWAVSIMRKVRPMPGSCDVTKPAAPAPETPAAPAPPK